MLEDHTTQWRYTSQSGKQGGISIFETIYTAISEEMSTG